MCIPGIGLCSLFCFGALMLSDLNINGRSRVILRLVFSQLLFWNDSSFFLFVSMHNKRMPLLKTANFPLIHATSENETQYVIDQNVRGMQFKVVLNSLSVCDAVTEALLLTAPQPNTLTQRGLVISSVNQRICLNKQSQKWIIGLV